MVNYIIQLAQGTLAIMDDVEKRMGPTADSSALSTELRRVVPMCATLVEEVRRLDPRDFLPDARYEFLVARLDLELWLKQWNPGDTGSFVNQFNQEPKSRPAIRNLLKRIMAVLDKYGGEGWRAQTRSFSFIKDADLRQIIERDYKELALVLFPGGAWKSTVIMAGSILEAILFDVLAADPATRTKAQASPVAPKGPMEDWRLEYLIKVAADIGVLPAKRALTFDQVLRDYRNFVHPKKEVRSGHPCREGEAQLAIGGLNAVCDLLESLWPAVSRTIHTHRRPGGATRMPLQVRGTGL